MGRIVVPKKLRDALHLTPGTRLMLERAASQRNNGYPVENLLNQLARCCPAFRAGGDCALSSCMDAPMKGTSADADHNRHCG